MIADLWNLFVALLRSSNLGFGGGQAIIPLIQAEAVDRFQWMSNAEFTDALAVANALPGPIATKIATYIGYQVASWPGVIVALTATIAPTVLIMIFLGNILVKYANSPALKGALKGVRPIVVALMALVTYQMSLAAFNIQISLDYLTFVIAAGAAATLYFFKIHPALLIVSSMFVGYVIF